MKRTSYVLLALIAIFVNSTAYGVEARVPTVSITKALQNARSKDNFAALKSTKFDVKQNKKDLIRSWTIKINKKRYFTNALLSIQNQMWLEIK